MSELIVDSDGVLGDFLSPCLDIINRRMMSATICSEEDHSNGCTERCAPIPERWSSPRMLADMKHWDIFESLGVTPEVKAATYREMKMAGWCFEKIQPFPPAKEAIALARKLGHDITVVTSPMDGPTWTHERDRWLKKHFDIDHKHVIHTDKKYRVVGDVFVDDKPEHVISWARRHGAKGAVLWDYVTNQHVREKKLDLEIKHLNDWMVVINMLENVR